MSGADYYLPAPADFPIRSLWRWMRKYSPAGIDYYPDVRLPADSNNLLPREQVLDRYHQHVKGCKACSVCAPPLACMYRMAFLRLFQQVLHACVEVTVVLKTRHATQLSQVVFNRFCMYVSKLLLSSKPGMQRIFLIHAAVARVALHKDCAYLHLVEFQSLVFKSRVCVAGSTGKCEAGHPCSAGRYGGSICGAGFPVCCWAVAAFGASCHVHFAGRGRLCCETQAAGPRAPVCVR